MSSTDSNLAVIYTEPGQNIGLVLKEILKSLSWPNTHVTADINEVTSYVNSGKANMIIIDDSPSRPAPISLRQIVNDPIASLTPILILLSESHRSEVNSLSTLGRPMIAYKPLTPGRFAPGFKTLLKVWGTPLFKEVEEARDLFINNETEKAMQALTKLTRNPKSQAIVAPGISCYLRDTQNIKVAEKILLASLKNSPRDLGLIMALSNLYLSSAMPHTSLRLMKGVDMAYGSTSATYLDKLQANLMLGKIQPCINILHEMIDRQIEPFPCEDFLSRLLFTDGRTSEFLRLIDNDTKARKFSDAWKRKVEPQHPSKMQAS